MQAAQYFGINYLELRGYVFTRMGFLGRKGFVSGRGAQAQQKPTSSQLIEKPEACQPYEDREPTIIEEMDNPYFNCTDCSTWRARCRRFHPDRDVCVYCYGGISSDDERHLRTRWCRSCNSEKNEAEFFDVVEGYDIDNEWCADH